MPTRTATTTRSALATTPVAPAKLAHVVLRTAHFEEAKQWYCTVLAGQVVFSNPFLAFLTYDDEHHRVALINSQDAPPPDRKAAGLDHVAFTYASMGDLLATYARLKAADITPYWCINHGPTTSLYYRDPDGTQVELQIDNYPDPDDLAAWFRSGAFKKNPIGVEFDPDRLLERFERGDPLDELIQQGSA